MNKPKPKLRRFRVTYINRELMGVTIRAANASEAIEKVMAGEAEGKEEWLGISEADDGSFQAEEVKP